MQVGSLVELIDNKWDLPPFKNEEYPIKGVIYTIREILFNKERNITSIRLEEIINPSNHYFDNTTGECSFKIKRFRELQPPMDISLELHFYQTELI